MNDVIRCGFCDEVLWRPSTSATEYLQWHHVCPTAPTQATFVREGNPQPWNGCVAL